MTSKSWSGWALQLDYHGSITWSCKESILEALQCFTCAEWRQGRAFEKCMKLRCNAVRAWWQSWWLLKQRHAIPCKCGCYKATFVQWQCPMFRKRIRAGTRLNGFIWRTLEKNVNDKPWFDRVPHLPGCKSIPVILPTFALCIMNQILVNSHAQPV